MIHREIVVRPITGFGAVEGLAPIQYLIDAVTAGTATKADADAAEAGVIQIQEAYSAVTPAASPKTFSWQNIMLGFAGGIFTASVAFAAFGELEPARRRSAPRLRRR